ncbi:MAG: ABC transporter ATP-binding protein [Gemmatimonadota bacterium]
MASIRFEDVHKTYPNGHIAARGLELEIAEAELMVLVGPSGCGKSTAMRMVAGLETPTSGRIFIGERDVTAVPPQERDVAMVFQSYALYPHMSVRDNLAFGLRMRRAGRGMIDERVVFAAKVLGLERLLDRKPGQLSGGQRQRVALGRAIVREPAAFLFDEPLSNLDAKLRVQTRAELSRLHRRLGATMLYVTHDQEEAMTLGSRVAVMFEGVFQQVAPPMEVYRRPANVFVAGFVGSPAMNFFSCELREEGGAKRLIGGSLVLPLGPAEWQRSAGREVTLGVRPHDITFVPPGEGDMQARVDVVEPLGSELLVHLQLGADRSGPQVRAVVPPETKAVVDDVVGLRFHRERLHLFDAESEKRLN